MTLSAIAKFVVHLLEEGQTGMGWGGAGEEKGERRVKVRGAGNENA